MLGGTYLLASAVVNISVDLYDYDKKSGEVLAEVTIDCDIVDLGTD